MTDAVYCFRETERTSKRIARGAYSKRRGSKTKYVSLPSDHLTEKERKKLNGTVETINTMKVMEYSAFKNLSKSLQKEYLKALYKIHGARTADIAEMFGISPSTLLAYLKLREIKNGDFATLSEAFKKKSPSEAWVSFIRSNSIVQEEPEVQKESASEEAPEDNQEDKPKQVVGELPLQRCDMSYIEYVAEGDPWVIFGNALRMVELGKEYRIQIRIAEAGKALSNF